MQKKYKWEWGKDFLSLINVGRKHLLREKSGRKSSPGVENGSFPIPSQFRYRRSWGTVFQHYPEFPIIVLDSPFVTLSVDLYKRIGTTLLDQICFFFKPDWWYCCSQVTCNTLGVTYLHNKGLRIQQHVFCCSLILHSAYHGTELAMSLFLKCQGFA